MKNSPTLRMPTIVVKGFDMNGPTTEITPVEMISAVRERNGLIEIHRTFAPTVIIIDQEAQAQFMNSYLKQVRVLFEVKEHAEQIDADINEGPARPASHVAGQDSEENL